MSDIAPDQKLDPYAMISPIFAVQPEIAFLRRASYVGPDEHGGRGRLENMDLIVSRYTGKVFATVADAEDSLLLPCAEGPDDYHEGTTAASSLRRMINRMAETVAARCRMNSGNIVLMNTTMAEELLTSPDIDPLLAPVFEGGFDRLVARGHPVGRWQLLPILLDAAYRLYVSDTFPSGLVSVCYCGPVKSALPGALIEAASGYTMVFETGQRALGDGRDMIATRHV